jgi:hypothetical protein
MELLALAVGTLLVVVVMSYKGSTVGRVKVEFIAVESVIVGLVTLDVVTVDRSTVNLVAVGGAFSGCMVGSVTVVKVAVCRVVTVEVGSDLPVESRLGHGTVGHSSNRMMHHEF